LTALNWTHAGPTLLAAFLASLVECVEALTVVLAVGSVRGWRAALGGSAAALGVMLGLILILGGALGRVLARVPMASFQAVVGALLLLFGLRWLRKAVLRASGHIPLHDEAAAFSRNAEAMRELGAGAAWDRIAFAAAFQITMLEGAEVVFIVLAIGAAGAGLLLPASLGALAALVVVALLGLVLHRPLARVPENGLKFAVGVLLSSFGTFWTGEGFGLAWPGGDWSLAGLIAAYLAVALLGVLLCRRPGLDTGAEV
jgi:uncharacterized membrane protein